jgi:hypothetical protein
VEARSSDAALHPSSSCSNSPYIAWRCVLGHCPVEKQVIVGLSANQMGWYIAAECCGSHDGYVCLESQQQSTPTPSHLFLHASRGNHTCRDHPFIFSASHKDTAVGTKNLKFGVIRPKTDFHQSNVHCLCFLDKASLFSLLVSFSSGFPAAHRP